MLRTLGQWMGKIRRMATEFQGQFQEAHARGRDRRPEEAGRRDVEHGQRTSPTSIRSPTRRRTSSAPSTKRRPPIADAARRASRRRRSPRAGRRAGTDAAAARDRRAAAGAAGRRSAENDFAAAEPPPAKGREAGRGRRMSQDEDIEASKAPLMEHLIELRSRLIKALIAFGVMFALCFVFAKQIYNVLVWPFVWVAGAGEFQIHLHRAAGIFHHPAEAGDVRRGLPVVPGGGDADLHVRRARPLPQRAQGVPAVSGRDAVLLRARRDGGLFPGACRCWCGSRSACSSRAARARPRSRCCPRSANICR